MRTRGGRAVRADVTTAGRTVCRNSSGRDVATRGIEARFNDKDRVALRQRALRAAVEDSRTSARTIAEAAGVVTLWEVVRI
ncbi:MAG: hypothetical protein M3R38_15355 [Actinomycetota bacterium]|nr:hypothetical protein [Actinomycetota bacterium]